MSKKIDYTFKIDGEFDSVNYYRSETPFDVNNMPNPTASGIRNLYYTDTNVEEGKTYYVRFGSVVGNEEKISEEVNLIVPSQPNPSGDYLLYMPFDQDFNDYGMFELVPELIGTPTIQDGALYVSSSDYLKLTPTQEEFVIGDDDFELGFEIMMMPYGNGSFPCVFGVGAYWASGAISIQFNTSKILSGAFVVNSAQRDAPSLVGQAYDGLTWHTYIVRRINGEIITYHDGVMGTPLNIPIYLDFKKNNLITIGAAVWSLGVTTVHGKIKNLYLKRM